MSKDDYAHRMLIQRYADGRPICNCAMAYLTLVKDGAFADGRPVDDWGCMYGCESNKAEARNEVAWRAAKELGLIPDSEPVPFFHSHSAWREKIRGGHLEGFIEIKRRATRKPARVC